MSENTAEGDVARLTDKEIELREWLRSQPGGAERWTVVKAGFRRSYDMGMRDSLNTRPDGEKDAAELRALRRVAEAATPGSWDAVVMGSEGYDVRAPNLDSPIRRLRVARCGYEKWEIDRANAEHIAAFDPPTVLALLDEIERLRACVTSPDEAER